MAASDDVGVAGYRILRDGTELATASATSYTDVTPPAGRPVSYAVRAVDGAGNLGPLSVAMTISVPSPTTPPARPSMLAPPSIAGSLTRGSLLTARPGTWSGTAPLRLAFRWQRCNASGQRCVAVAGARRATYRAGAADVGRTIRVVVRVSNAHGSASAASAITARVARKALRTRRR